MAPNEQNALLRVLQERDLDLNEDDFAWAFREANTRDTAAAFVKEYLQPSTLLTRDELDYFERHDLPHDDQALLPGKPMSDGEFKSAIAALEASTAAIERQSRILQTQKEALEDIKARNVAGASRSDGQESRKKLVREKAQLEFEVDELSQDVTSRLLSASKQTDSATSGLSSQLDRLLEKDDRLLDGLQKLLPKVSEIMIESDDSANVEQLSSALASMSVKEIQTRLNRAYREGVAEHRQQANGTASQALTDQQQKQIETLRTELEELSGEIEGLVGIVVDHHYRKPLQQSQTNAIAESQSQRAKWTEYTISALGYLASRLDVIHEHVQRLHAHGTALRSVSATMDNVLKKLPNTNIGSSAALPSRTPDGSSARGLKPLRLVQANLSEGQDPALQFLRQHDIRATDLDDVPKLGHILDSTFRERKRRLIDLSRSSDLSGLETLVQTLAKVDREAQDLSRAVHASSTSAAIKLVNQDLQAGIGDLEADTQRLGDEMRRLDIDSVTRTITATQAEILQHLTTAAPE